MAYQACGDGYGDPGRLNHGRKTDFEAAGHYPDYPRPSNQSPTNQEFASSNEAVDAPDGG